MRSWERDHAPWRKSGGGQQPSGGAAGSIWDQTGLRSGGDHLLGSGASLELSSLIISAVEGQEAMLPFEDGRDDDTEAIAFDRAQCKDGVVFHSTQHRRPRSRKSFFALCTATVGDAEAASTFVVRIRRFVLFRRSRTPEVRDVRRAEVELYDCVETEPSLFTASGFEDGVSDIRLAMVPLSCLKHKLIYCRDEQVDGVLHLFIRYSRSIGGGNLGTREEDAALPADSDEEEAE